MRRQGAELRERERECEERGREAEEARRRAREAEERVDTLEPRVRAAEREAKVRDFRVIFSLISTSKTFCSCFMTNFLPFSSSFLSHLSLSFFLFIL